MKHQTISVDMLEVVDQSASLDSPQRLQFPMFLSMLTIKDVHNLSIFLISSFCHHQRFYYVWTFSMFQSRPKL